MASKDDAALLKAAIEENARLKEENQRLRSLLGMPKKKSHPPIATSLSPEDKVTLFQSLFREREDVYPRRWEARTGESGYSPACVNECKRPLCGKPRKTEDQVFGVRKPGTSSRNE